MITTGATFIGVILSIFSLHVTSLSVPLPNYTAPLL